jgi:hypothetical protein
MNIEVFWDVVETARSRRGPDATVDQALTAYLATFSEHDLLEYQRGSMSFVKRCSAGMSGRLLISSEGCADSDPSQPARTQVAATGRP